MIVIIRTRVIIITSSNNNNSSNIKSYPPVLGDYAIAYIPT